MNCGTGACVPRGPPSVTRLSPAFINKYRKCSFADLGKAREMDGKQPLESFIARIWLERGSGEDSVWRGHVRHVQGEEETYFQDLGAMSEFLECVSGVSWSRRIGEAAKRGRGSGSAAKEKNN